MIEVSSFLSDDELEEVHVMSGKFPLFLKNNVKEK
jgi:hypothetical protein